MPGKAPGISPLRIPRHHPAPPGTTRLLRHHPASVASRAPPGTTGWWSEHNRRRVWHMSRTIAHEPHPLSLQAEGSGVFSGRRGFRPSLPLVSHLSVTSVGLTSVRRIRRSHVCLQGLRFNVETVTVGPGRFCCNSWPKVVLRHCNNNWPKVVLRRCYECVIPCVCVRSKNV